MSIINKIGFFRMLYIGHTSPLLNILHLHTYTIISIFLVQHVLVATGNVLLVWSRRLETTVSQCLDFAMAFEIVQDTLQMKRTSVQQVNICYAPDSGCIDLQDTYHLTLRVCLNKILRMWSQNQHVETLTYYCGAQPITGLSSHNISLCDVSPF